MAKARNVEVQNRLSQLQDTSKTSLGKITSQTRTEAATSASTRVTVVTSTTTAHSGECTYSISGE